MSNIVVFLLALVGLSTAQQCGDTVTLAPGQSITIQSQDTSTIGICSINIARASPATAIDVICPAIKMCFFSWWCGWRNYVRFNDGSKMYNRNNVAFSYTDSSVLNLKYSHRTHVWLTGDGFSCTFSAIETGSSFSCECGLQTSTAERIIGGTITAANEYPWTVRLSISNSGLCGGTIISPYCIISAAHCVEGMQFTPSLVKIYAGEHHIDTAGQIYETTYTASKVTIHSSYNSATLVNDIALICVNSPMTFNNGVRAVCLPHQGESLDGHTATIVGWGLTSPGGDISRFLQAITLPIITNSVCSSAMGEYPLSNTMVCAYASGSGKDACQGDSGGPLTYVKDRLTTLGGIVSWGFGCATSPGVYTRVPSYIDWIQTQTTEDICIP